MNMFGRKADGFAHGVREHVKLGPKITDMVKGKLRLGARILQCYLSTTSGPIAGLLFISTHKVAFCSEKSIKISSPKGEFLRAHYKTIDSCQCPLYYEMIVLIDNMYFRFRMPMVVSFDD
ncbi:hypothetical protein L195_g003902 [Trifolium pratense]|uniref:GRAM domain-containing protein n=1 Tax=Trifolium pratense TaxID=57577 RepID=A0A2K3NWI7_TRIPR|nr:hypothetical protein L195_g003902 [Trifolium pratense]